jgi:hypothetical protein
VAQTRTKDWRAVSSPRQRRFVRTARQPQTGRRFARSSPQTAQTHRFGRSSARAGAGGIARTRRRQPQRSGAQGLLQNLKSVLPGGSSGKRGSRGAIPGVGGLRSSLGGAKGGRGRKPAMLGLLGAGAAGAAAVVAKRRKGSGSSEASGAPEHLTAESQTAAKAPAETTPAPPRTEYPAAGGGESA